MILVTGGLVLSGRTPHGHCSTWANPSCSLQLCEHPVPVPSGRGRLPHSGPPQPGTDGRPGTARPMQAPSGTASCLSVICGPDVAWGTYQLPEVESVSGPAALGGIVQDPPFAVR